MRVWTVHTPPEAPRLARDAAIMRDASESALTRDALAAALARDARDKSLARDARDTSVARDASVSRDVTDGTPVPNPPTDAPTTGRKARPRPPVLVREGFAWLAFFFALPWLLWHRLWLETVIYLGLVAILAALVPAGAVLPAALALHFLLGAHARDLRRWSLARRGYIQAHVVAERDADRALLRLIEARPELAPILARAALA